MTLPILTAPPVAALLILLGCGGIRFQARLFALEQAFEQLENHLCIFAVEVAGRLIREQDRVRLISRGGHDWARRFPLIVTAALKLRQEHFVLDGETVVLGLDGVSNFGALRSGRHNERAQFYAFGMLAGDGEDQRQLPLSLRKTNLARLLKRRIPGVFIAEYEEGEIGRDLFRVACTMGLEGMVSKHRDRAYTPGKCRHWVKTKNPAHPPYGRVRDQLLVTRSRSSRGRPK